jgi:hypothetical protein
VINGAVRISRWLLGKQTERRGPCVRHLAVGVSDQGNPVASGVATHVSQALTTVASERIKRMKRMKHPCFEGPEMVGRHGKVSYMVCVRPDDPTVEALSGQGVQDEDLALQVAVDVCEVLTALHKMGIAHGQVGPKTVHVQQHHDLVRGVLADPAAVLWPGAPHEAPEVRTGHVPDARADLFGLGRVLESLCSEEERDARLQHLLDELLAPDPRDRPRTASEVLTRVAALRDDRRPTGWARLINLFAS